MQKAVGRILVGAVIHAGLFSRPPLAGAREMIYHMLSYSSNVQAAPSHLKSAVGVAKPWKVGWLSTGEGVASRTFDPRQKKVRTHDTRGANIR